MKSLPFAVLAGLLLSPVAFAQDIEPDATAPGVQVETLLASPRSWDGKLYGAYPRGNAEMTVLRITIPAHTALGWHEHPEPNAAYIVSGKLTIEKKNGTKKVVKAGDAVAETANTIHRGVTGNTPVVLLAFYAGVKGIPVTKSVP